MGINNSNSRDNQEHRLAVKTIHQQMLQLAINGAGLTKWAANELIRVIDDVYFSNSQLTEIKNGQIKYSCTSAKEGPGKPLADCEMVTVILTLHDPDDDANLPVAESKQRQVKKRWRRAVRICTEAKDQGGLLTQEDLAELLMCDTKTICRLVADMKKAGFILPTRGTLKDIGPGVTHRELIICKWIQGHEPVAITQSTNHSIVSVENYINKFKIIVYLRTSKHFTDHEIAVVAGVSQQAVKIFLELYDKYKSEPTYKHRLQDINLSGNQYYTEVGEKKDLSQPKPSNSVWSKA